jgi:hypothetical protein
MNILLWVFLWTYVCIFPRWIPKHEITHFNYVRSYQIFTQVLYHSYQQCVSIPVAPQPWQHLMLSIVHFIYSGGRMLMSHCSFILHSLMNNGVEHFFICFLSICVSHFVKFLFKYFAYFKNGVILFFLLSYSSLCIMHTSYPVLQRFSFRLKFV